MEQKIKDEEDLVKEIEGILIEAWNTFLDYYEKKTPEYPKKWGFKKEKAKRANWICWNEYDLMLQIGRFFYDILKEKKENQFSNIEMHIEKKVDLTNFKDREFEDKLEQLKIRLINKKVLKRNPKIDMIVAYQDKKGPFLLCAEVKYFRYAHNHYAKDPITEVNKDIEKLKAIRDLEIAKKVVFLLFDDYYWCNDVNTANAIQKKLEKIRNEESITVLNSTSKAKLEKYKQ